MIAIIDSSYCEILANAGVNWGGFMFRRLFPPFGRVNSLVYIFCLGGRFCWTYLYLENMKGEKDMKKKLMIAGMISVLLLSPFSNVLSCGNESVGSTTLQDKRPGHRGPGASMLTDELIETLSLSDEQVKSWKEIESDFREKMDAMRPDMDSDERPDPEEMRAKMDAMMQAYDASVKEILSDEQYKQFQEYREKNRPKGRPGQRPERMDEPEHEWDDEIL